MITRFNEIISDSKDYFFLVVIAISFSSCLHRDLEYGYIASHPNYFDSLSLEAFTFIQNIESFSFIDSIEDHLTRQYPQKEKTAIYEENSFFKKGCQVINLFQTLEESYRLKKPILLHFTSMACVNCREMEDDILENEKIKSRLKSNFIFITLSVDDKTKLPKERWIPSQKKYNGNRTSYHKHIGEINSYFQSYLTQIGSQPTFIALDLNRNLGTMQYTTNINNFNSYLDVVIEKYND